MNHKPHRTKDGLFIKCHEVTLNKQVEQITVRGPYADLLLASKPLSPQGRRRLREETDALYDLFVARVADSRGLEIEQVDAVGRGRVWTGAQAVENGLIDGLGGLRAAVLRAKRDLGLAEEVDVALIPYPTPKTLTEQVNDALRRVALQSVGGSGLSEVMSRIEPWLAAAPEGALALLPPYLVEIR